MMEVKNVVDESSIVVILFKKTAERLFFKNQIVDVRESIYTNSMIMSLIPKTKSNTSLRKELQKLQIQNVTIPDSDTSDGDEVIVSSQEFVPENSKKLVAKGPKKINNSRNSKYEVQHYYCGLRKGITVCSKVPIRDGALVKVLAMGQAKKTLQSNKEAKTTVMAESKSAHSFSGSKTNDLQQKSKVLPNNVESLPSLQESTHSVRRKIGRPRKQKYIYLRRRRWEGRLLKQKYVLPLPGYSPLDIIRSS